MPRDVNGVYTLPAIYKATTGTTILAAQHNGPMEDIQGALTGSLPRDGSAPMTAALKLADGDAAVPALRFQSIAGRGLYKTTDGIGIAIAGVKVAEFTSDGLTVNGLLPEAPDDGKLYGRKSKAWSEVPSGNFYTETDRRSLLLAHIRASKSLGTRQFIFTGAADGFGAADGINTGASTNYRYESANRWITPSNAVGADQIPSMTGPTTGGVTMSDGGNSGPSFAAWVAGDKNVATSFSQNPFSVNNYIRTDFGSGNDKLIGSYAMHCGVANHPTAFKLQGSTNGSTWVDLDSRSGIVWANAWQTFIIPNPGTYRYYQVVFLSTSSGVLQVNELTLNVYGAPQSMTLVTATRTVDTAPSMIRVGILAELTESITLNTDLTAEVTRTGAAWAAAALTGFKLGGNIWFYESGLIDVSGQASGTSVAARFKTANGKSIRLLGDDEENFA